MGEEPGALREELLVRFALLCGSPLLRRAPIEVVQEGDDLLVRTKLSSGTCSGLGCLALTVIGALVATAISPGDTPLPLIVLLRVASWLGVGCAAWALLCQRRAPPPEPHVILDLKRRELGACRIEAVSNHLPLDAIDCFVVWDRESGQPVGGRVTAVRRDGNNWLI